MRKILKKRDLNALTYEKFKEAGETMKCTCEDCGTIYSFDNRDFVTLTGRRFSDQDYEAFGVYLATICPNCEHINEYHSRLVWFIELTISIAVLITVLVMIIVL